jgi:pimeloyl-ACP methyl ester carboxylesterase
MPIVASLYYFAYRERDMDKTPIVLIHGAGGTNLYWPPEIRRLSGYRLYALDLPGHGKSNGSEGQQTIGEYTRHVLDWLNTVGLHRAVFVGHSMGSAIAMTLAIHHPEHVLGLGLLGAGARLRVHPEILDNAASTATYHKAIEVIVDWSFSTDTSERLVELASQRMIETRSSVFHGDLMACNAFDVMSDVGSIRQPTLVICGETDKMTPMRYSQFLADAIPTAKLAVIPNAGHMVMLEQPQATAEALSSFLDEIPYHPGEVDT